MGAKVPWVVERGRIHPRTVARVNPLLVAASALVVVVALVHSVFGERLIFRHLRSRSIAATRPAPPLRSSHVRILWATWHLASALALGLAIVLGRLALDPSPDTVMLWAIAGAFTVSGALVLGATSGRHPGWIGLFASAVLVAIAAVS